MFVWCYNIGLACVIDLCGLENMYVSYTCTGILILSGSVFILTLCSCTCPLSFRATDDSRGHSVL